MSYESKVLAFRNLYDEISRRIPATEGKIFKEEFIHADFNKYVKCSFVGCALILEFGICSFINCDFDHCRFEVKDGSPASLILHLDRKVRESASKDASR